MRLLARNTRTVSAAHTCGARRILFIGKGCLALLPTARAFLGRSSTMRFSTPWRRSLSTGKSDEADAAARERGRALLRVCT
eukprot:scaffold153541_cov33-Tisochrysis_lutea.AAC.2